MKAIRPPPSAGKYAGAVAEARSAYDNGAYLQAIMGSAPTCSHISVEWRKRREDVRCTLRDTHVGGGLALALCVTEGHRRRRPRRGADRDVQAWRPRSGERRVDRRISRDCQPGVGGLRGVVPRRRRQHRRRAPRVPRARADRTATRPHHRAGLLPPRRLVRERDLGGATEAARRHEEVCEGVPARGVVVAVLVRDIARARRRRRATA